jgi:predicted transposase/invertase (TIGR01784 family)
MIMALEDKYINPLQEKIYEKLFAAAEIAKFSKQEREMYEESLKFYRDIKNVVDTAFDDGKSLGKIEGKIEQNYQLAKKLKEKGLPIELIIEVTGLSAEEIEKL